MEIPSTNVLFKTLLIASFGFLIQARRASFDFPSSSVVKEGRWRADQIFHEWKNFMRSYDDLGPGQITLNKKAKELWSDIKTSPFIVPAAGGSGLHFEFEKVV